MTIYDLIVSSEIVAYWELMQQEREPYMGEELFPADKKLGLNYEERDPITPILIGCSKDQR